jgi:hypothetical protein
MKGRVDSQYHSVFVAALVLVLVALSVFLLRTVWLSRRSGAVAAASDQPDREYSATQRSKHGEVIATILVNGPTIPTNQIHSWLLKVSTNRGRPLPRAAIVVDALMPEHSHGMATKPRVTQELDQGVYLVDGMKFQMSGRWVVGFGVRALNVDDEVYFDVVVP